MAFAMIKQISPRLGFLLITVACAGLLGYALYEQHVEWLDPCPLCIFQRIAFMGIGIFALLLCLQNPQGWLKPIYGGLLLLASLFGMLVAGRHIWMQNLPADQVPECGPGLEYMLDNFSLGQTLAKVFQGSGSCADIKWEFLGLSMPWWTMIWYLGLAAAAVVLLTKRGQHEQA